MGRGAGKAQTAAVDIRAALRGRSAEQRRPSWAPIEPRPADARADELVRGAEERLSEKLQQLTVAVSNPEYAGEIGRDAAILVSYANALAVTRVARLLYATPPEIAAAESDADAAVRLIALQTWIKTQVSTAGDLRNGFAHKLSQQALLRFSKSLSDAWGRDPQARERWIAVVLGDELESLPPATVKAFARAGFLERFLVQASGVGDPRRELAKQIAAQRV